MIKLVLSDMDNTLIPFGERHASPRTIEAIHALLDAGVRFGPDTGRDYTELLRFFRMDESCFDTGILSNGKRVKLDGEYIHTQLIDHDLLVRVDEALRGKKDMFLVCFPAETNVLNPGYCVGCTSAEAAAFEGRTGFVAGIVDEVPRIDMIAAAIACPGGDDRADLCRRLVAEAVPEVDLALPIPEWFDVLPKGSNKASGLAYLTDALGISTDEVVVFGDAENDLAIIREVRYSVAVANAMPAVAEAANFHVGDVRDEGVADALFEIARATKAGEMPAFLQEA